MGSASQQVAISSCSPSCHLVWPGLWVKHGTTQVLASLGQQSKG